MKIRPIGFVKTPFKEKFGIPRQGLESIEDVCQIQFDQEFSAKEFFRGLEEFSHIWIHSYLDQSIWNKRSTTRPPRLGGKTRMGIFSTRGPHRPNPLGLSLVKIINIRFENGIAYMDISLVDLLNDTPVLDIKPYIKDYDFVPHSNEGWNLDIPKNEITVEFDDLALKKLEEKSHNPEDFGLKYKTINEILKNDPRPGYLKQKDSKIYATKLFDFDLTFKSDQNRLIVIDIR